MFLPTIRRQFEFPAAQYFINSQVKNKTKLQFFFIRLKKRLNLKPEWNKMTEKSSMLKKIVHISSENILLDLKLTSELIGRSDYHDESNSFLFKLKWKVRFLSRRSEQAQKFVKFLDESLIMIYMAILTLFFNLIWKKLIIWHKYSNESVVLCEWNTPFRPNIYLMWHFRIILSLTPTLS